MERLAGSRWVEEDWVFGIHHRHSAPCRHSHPGLPGCARASLAAEEQVPRLRHATATFLLAQGFTLEDVKNPLGHSSIVLTSNTYGHVLEQRQVAAVMDAALGG